MGFFKECIVYLLFLEINIFSQLATSFDVSQNFELFSGSVL